MIGVSLIKNVFFTKKEVSKSPNSTSSNPIVQNNLQQAPVNNTNNINQYETLKPISVNNADYINENDLKRYKKVQKEWAKDFGARHNIDPQTIEKLLPEIRGADPVEMIKNGAMARYVQRENVIELNPIKEILNLRGGDEARVVHESFHAFASNLRTAYAKSVSKEDIYNDIYSQVRFQMLRGENNLVFKNTELKKINGKEICCSTIMQPPFLTAKERTCLVNFIDNLDEKHIDYKNSKFTEKGHEFVRKKLLPNMTQLKKQFEGIATNADEKAEKLISDYAFSIFTRVNAVRTEFYCKELNNPIKLNKNEANLAKEAIGWVLSTQEGNFVRAHVTSTYSPKAFKMYFTSAEESMARREENLYRLGKIDNVIKIIKSHGINPSENLLKEKNTIENSVRLIDLSNELIEIEQEMTSMPKNLDKIRRYNLVLKKINEVKTNPEIQDTLRISQELRPQLSGKTYKEKMNLFKNALGDRFELYNKYVKTINKGTDILNKMNTPSYFMKLTSETFYLKTRYKDILNQIQELAPNCSLTAIPKQYFSSTTDYMTNLRKSAKIFEKWAKQLC